MEPECVSHEIEIAEGKKVTVLKPIIDHVSLTMSGKEAIGVMCQKTDSTWEAVAYNYWKGFYNLTVEATQIGSGKIEASKGFNQHYKICADINIDENQRVRLCTCPRGKTAPPVRIEFNPSKLGPQAMWELASIWEEIDFHNFPLPSLMSDARITRIDVAIDCIGLSPVDIIVYNKDVWKVWSATSPKEGVQTANHYKSSGIYKSPSVSPKRRADLMVYDKREEQLAKGIEPIYGEQEHTRIELSLNTKSLLKSLKTRPYPFETWNIRRTLVSDPPFDDWLWKLVLDSARYRGINAAYSLVPENLRKSVKLEAEKHAPADLITEEKTWCHWPEALEKYHVGQLIEWAEAGPEGFLPFASVPKS